MAEHKLATLRFVATFSINVGESAGLGGDPLEETMLIVALSEGALLVARADDREAELEEVEATIARLLHSLSREQSR